MRAIVESAIEDYAVSKTEPHGALLAELMQETYATMEMPMMLCGPLEGRFLKFMTQTVNAVRALEIGMFTGYSALSMAEGLPENGQLYTCEINPKAVEIAKRYFARSQYGYKIKVCEGPALETIKGLDGSFDLVFIDADKENYTNYYEAVLPLVRSGGVILVDNVLWSGAVLAPKTDSDKAICAFNDRVAKDERVDRILLTLRDGVYLIRKR